MVIQKRTLQSLLFLMLTSNFLFMLVSCSGNAPTPSPQEPQHIQIVIEDVATEKPVKIEPIQTEEVKNQEPGRKLPAFDLFIEKIKNGNGDEFVGLWVENKMALNVVYQPINQPAFVSEIDNVATYFMMAYEYSGNHGLLAHNFLAGRFFFDVVPGDIVTLVYGDGNYEDYEVVSIKDFQALDPRSPFSDFVDQNSGETISAKDLFLTVYAGDFHTTLQTCIKKGTEGEWGRHFTLAPPL